MISAIYIVFLAIAAAEQPRAVPTAGGHDLFLTLPMLRALDAWEPSFRPWQDRDYDWKIWCLQHFPKDQAPFAAIGDFNGDGLPDVALHGRSGRQEVVVVLLSESSGAYAVHQVVRFGVSSLPQEPSQRRLDTFVELTRAGTHFTGAFAGHPLTLRRDAFQFVICEKAAELYFWDGDKFERYVTGD
jgi:hypothetical protein